MPKQASTDPVYVNCSNPAGCPRNIRNLKWLIERRGWLIAENGQVFCPTHRAEHEAEGSEWVVFSNRIRPYVASALDEEAAELGITRNALIRVILSNHLEGRN